MMKSPEKRMAMLNTACNIQASIVSLINGREQTVFMHKLSEGARVTPGRVLVRKKFFVWIGIIVVALALVTGPANAQTDGKVSFGIRPTKAYEDRPETFSYFSYELTPGVVLDDEALVMNSGDVPVTLTLFGADGITAHNGGTAFAKQGQESTGGSRGVSGWLSLPVTELFLEPGEELIVPFTINVPPDVSPGHHVAGLVVKNLPSEEAPPSGDGDGQFAAKVVQQAGVAVVIDVPGPHIAGLEISDAILKQQSDDLGATFGIFVHNTGNIFIKAEGFLVVNDINLQELASIPLKMDTVLPGDTTRFSVTHPIHFSDSDYLLNVVLNYEGGTAVLEGVEMQVRDGQPVVEGESEESSALPSIITEISSPRPDSEWSVGIKAFTSEYLNLNNILFVFLLFIDVAFIYMSYANWRKKQ